MENWQVNHIDRNLPFLQRQTKPDCQLKTILLAEEKLDDEDVEELDALAKNTEKAFRLYKILQTRAGGYEALAKALFQTGQSGALRILLKGFQENKIADPLTQSGIRVDPGKIVSSSVIYNQIEHKFESIFKGWNKSDSEELVSNTCLDNDMAEIFIFSCQPIKLLKNTIPVKPPGYISRFICNSSKINPDVFKQECLDVFVFKGIDRLELTQLAKPQTTAESHEQLEKINSRFILLQEDKDWEDLCKISNGPMYLISVRSEPKTYHLDKLFQSSSMILKHIEKQSVHDKKYISEDELLQQIIQSKTITRVCICDSAGMGKSSLLASLAQQITCVPESNRIVAFIYLPEFVHKSRKQLARKELNHETALLHSLRHISSSELSAAVLLKATQMRYIKMDLFLDGFDELQRKAARWAERFLKIIAEKQTNVNIYISSRPENRSQLEMTLGVLAYELRPFDSTNQLDFLIRSWSNKIPNCDNSKLEQFGLECLESVKIILSSQHQDIMGTPLHAFLFSEVATRQAELYSKREMSGSTLLISTSIYKMYKDFIMSRLFNKNDRGTGDSGYSDFHVKSFHTWKALELFYPEMAQNYASLVGLDTSKGSKHILACGLLEPMITDDVDSLRFVHQTYAEFLISDLFIETLINASTICDDMTLTKDLAQYFALSILATRQEKQLDLYLSDFMNSPNDRGEFLPNEYLFRYSAITNFLNLYPNIEKSSMYNPTLSDYFFSLLKPNQLYKILIACITEGQEYLLGFIIRLLADAEENCKVEYKNYLFENCVQTQLELESNASTDEEPDEIDTMEPNDEIGTDETQTEESDSQQDEQSIGDDEEEISFQDEEEEVEEEWESEGEETSEEIVQRWIILWCLVAEYGSMGMVEVCERLFVQLFNQDLKKIFQSFPLWMKTPLHSAVIDVKYRLVEYFVNKIPLDNRSLIYYCAANSYNDTSETAKNRINICKLLLHHNKDLVNEYSYDEDGAAYSGALAVDDLSLEMIKLLVEAGADLNATFCKENIAHRASDYMSPADFHKLCCYLIDYLEAIHLFKTIESKWETPLIILLMEENDKIEIETIEKILQVNELSLFQEEENGMKLIKSAIRNKRGISIIEGLIRGGADFRRNDKQGKNLLHYAARMGNVALAQYFIDNGLSVNQLDNKGKSPLLVSSKHLEMIKCLITNNANIHETDNKLRNIGHMAASHLSSEDFDELVIFLSDSQSLCSLLQAKNRDGQTALQVRLQTNEITDTTLEKLLNLSGTEVNAKDNYGNNLFLSAIIGNRDIQTLQKLESHNADYKCCNNKGHNALDLAIVGENDDVQQYLRSLEVKPGHIGNYNDHKDSQQSDDKDDKDYSYEEDEDNYESEDDNGDDGNDVNYIPDSEVDVEETESESDDDEPDDISSDDEATSDEVSSDDA